MTPSRKPHDESGSEKPPKTKRSWGCPPDKPDDGEWEYEGGALGPYNDPSCPPDTAAGD